jgi:hypothetical protein
VGDFYKSGSKRKPVCAECTRAHRRVHDKPRPRPKTTEGRLRVLLWEHYRLSLEQFEAIAESQGGGCAICGDEPKGATRLSVDHCHATGVVRALLCTGCNTAVGVYELHRDRISAYLDRYGSGHPLWVSNARSWHPDSPGARNSPAGVEAVHDNEGRLWKRVVAPHQAARWEANGESFKWPALVANHGPVTEIAAPSSATQPAGRHPAAGPPNH